MRPEGFIISLCHHDDANTHAAEQTPIHKRGVASGGDWYLSKKLERTPNHVSIKNLSQDNKRGVASGGDLSSAGAGSRTSQKIWNERKTTFP